MIKIWLDDVREAPNGWTWYKTGEDLISFLKTNSWDQIRTISFDHDLGENRKTGYDVLTYMEEQVATYQMHVPKLSIHSANPVGRKNMDAAINAIHRYAEI